MPQLTATTLPGVTVGYDYNDTYLATAVTLTHSPVQASWIGFGLYWATVTYNVGFEMNGDVTLSYWNGTHGGICDLYLNSPTDVRRSGSDPPAVDPTNNLILVATSSDSSSWTVEFLKPINPGDAHDQQIFLNQPQNIFFAVNPNDLINPSCVMTISDAHWPKGGPGYFVPNFSFAQQCKKKKKILSITTTSFIQF